MNAEMPRHLSPRRGEGRPWLPPSKIVTTIKQDKAWEQLSTELAVCSGQGGLMIGGAKRHSVNRKSRAH